MSSEIRIVIADDHPLLRSGLRQIIETEARFKILAEAGDGQAALDLIESLRPEVAILDIAMPRMTGFELLRALRDRKVEVKTIFLTMFKDEDIFNEALDLGAHGFMLKDSAPAEINNCIHAVVSGQYYITPAISTYLLKRHHGAAALAKATPGLKDLTPTERRILKLITENKTSKEIAAELFISPHTVQNHRVKICQKLELKGVHSLVKFAFDHKSQLS